jgi:cytoplasmic iron level regulating protein YaaA (DUF328/UPF0246 family)|tara:strand:- start:239 stop:1012 length:774 start_codon:yes stop_codon:yes gene_type:complete
MIIVVSPAKNLDFTSRYDIQATKPRLLECTHELIANLQKKSVKDIEKMMGISNSLAVLNVQRYHEFKKDPSPEHSQPAVYAFNGDVYQGLQAPTFDAQKIDFAQSHLRIISGLYGLLRPLDLIQPYRLEMGTQLAFDDYKTLYEYWDTKIMNLLLEDLKAQNDNIIINLASNEYFKSVNKKEFPADVIDVEFKDFKNDKYKIISFYAKKARGMMSKYIIDHEISNSEDLKGFDSGGYYYDPEASSAQKIAFKRDAKR